MKNIFKYSAVAVAAFALASCSDLNQEPVFQRDDAFVAFSKSSVSVSEAAGTVTITLSQAAVDPIKSVVAYEVLDKKTDTTGTYTAEKGVNFVDNSIDGLLFFENGSRTASITFDIINPVDENGKTIFTGDLTFGIRILSASNKVDLGSDNECVVTISDLDHPLASILGEFNVAAESYFPDLGSESWTITISKVPNSITSVSIGNLWDIANYDPSEVVGTISRNDAGDIDKLIIPAGKTWVYGNYEFVPVVAVGGNLKNDQPMVFNYDAATNSFSMAAGQIYGLELFNGGKDQGQYDLYTEWTMTKK